MQINEVKICFTTNGKNYSFDCGDLQLTKGQKVIVETSRGLDIGTVNSEIKLIERDDNLEPFKKVLRVASKEDFKQKDDNKEKQEAIKQKCEELVKKIGLEMKILSAELAFDASKVLITFSSETRVDFRELLKNLVSLYKMRIELRQVDAREETKIKGGLGPCGRVCCCSKFLKEAEHSSIKMAKVQGLSLNPTNIAGLCGKLKCCLCYENDYYVEMSKIMPAVNAVVITPSGKGKVAYNDFLRKRVSVKIENEDGLTKIEEFELDQISKMEDNKNV